MKATTSTAVSLALLVLAILPAHAAEMKDMSGMKDMPGMKMDAEKAAGSPAHKGQGTVNGVDVKVGKINLTHGPIATLKWPGMTMDFQVKDKALLKGVTPGQNVEFDIVQQGPGQFVITRIAPAAKQHAGKAAKDDK
ncbi:MAG: copper-binding protein [Pseudomonadota bacterium]